MKVIVAIGGAVIKTALPEIKEVARRGMIDVLIHNGGSIFHDFQMVLEPYIDGAYYSLDKMLDDPNLASNSSHFIWEWIKKGEAPIGSLTEIMQNRGRTVLMFTAPGCDFWQVQRWTGEESWEKLGSRTYQNLAILKAIMRGGDFHYICMGSAVIHPEIFKTVLATTHPKNFRADVVDFLDMYRPKTRVARYGQYYQMSHKEYLEKVLKGEIKWGEI